ncbi:PilZ domain-containing protein [Halobacteriovorax sp. GFR7]|uniref:PilZ domain-containing protein n=1 Tax=unclassified Halobacteriovorax TaxID=2639665 RepID=UPI003D96C344
MLISISKLSIKSDFNKVQALFSLHMFLFFLAKGYEFFKFQFNFIALFGIIFSVILYRLYYRMQKNVHYSFWTLSVVVALFIIFYILRSLYYYNDFSLFFLYTMSLMLLGLLCFSLYTPVFYPVISWWEYDFRYRNDLKTCVYSEGLDGVEGRLVDLRRKAGGLTLFDDLKIGQKLEIEPLTASIDGRLSVEVVSKRQHSIGRPFTYGVRFHNTDETSRRRYGELEKYWNFERKAKKDKKFKS